MSSLSNRVRTFHVPKKICVLLSRPQERVNCQARPVAPTFVGHTKVGTLFLLPCLTRLSSAVLKRAAQSPGLLHNLLAAR